MIPAAPRLLLALLLVLGGSGCAAVVDGLVEGAIEAACDGESQEEREVREDRRRLREGRELAHHRSERHLRYHEQDLRWKSVGWDGR